MSIRKCCAIIRNMEIAYLGHSAFKIKTKSGTIVMDPYNPSVGLKLPSLSADIVTVSHDHEDHNNVKAVSGTSRRENPFVIREPGEYEIEGISIFGYQTFHDAKEGAERGGNVMYVIQAEDMRVLHLGDLGHNLSEKQIADLDGIDVVMVPVGGVYTVDAEVATKVIEAIDPSIVIPMHFKTAQHDAKTFGEMSELAKFTSQYGHAVRTVKTLQISKISLPQEATEVISFE